MNIYRLKNVLLYFNHCFNKVWVKLILCGGLADYMVILSRVFVPAMVPQAFSGRFFSAPVTIDFAIVIPLGLYVGIDFYAAFIFMIEGLCGQIPRKNQAKYK